MSVSLSSAAAVEEKRRRLARLLEERAALPQRFPLSFTQQRVWFLDQLDPGSPAYQLSTALHLSGLLRPAALEASLREIVRRHKVLRTRFTTHEGEPVQIVDRHVELALPVVDLSGLPEGPRQSELRRLVQGNLRTLFDLRHGHLFRSTLLRLGERQHAVLLATHHVVSDGWSMGVIVKELAALYPAFCAGRPSPLPRLPLQYAEYAVGQRRWLTGDVLDAQLGYWKERLNGAASLELPTDHPRPTAQTFRGAAVPFSCPLTLRDALAGLGRQQRATLFMTLLAVFQTLLGRFSGQEDVSVGSPIANRGRRELELLIGFFANTLVLRADLSGDPPFRELLARVRETALEAFAHQDMPLEKLVQEVQPERNLARPPLFQVLFALQTAAELVLELPDLALEPIEAERDAAKLELSLELADSSRGIQGVLEYNTDLFERSTAARLLGCFERLLEAVLAAPEQRLSELPLLSPGERQQILAEWNDTAAAYPGGLCLHELVAAQAARTPDAVAASFESEQLTCRELARRAGRLARHLAALGVGPEARVGVLLERSLEMIVGLLGVLEAGAAYVPLEPGLPAERLGVLVESAGLSVILTVERYAALIPPGSARAVLLDADWRDLEDVPAIRTAEGNLAYVLYTSGSTGAPKGVMIPHQGIVNRLLWMQQAYGLTAADRVLQKTPFGFDVSLWELFWPLLSGARLVFAQPEGHKNPLYLADRIAHEGITTLHFVPSMLEAFLEVPGLESLTSLRRVVASGEALPPRLVERFFARLGRNGGVELHNLYGPTEASVDVSSWPCVPAPPGSLMPIGRPIANHRLYVADRWLGAQPLGVSGELLLSGPGLARGYLGRPELTAAAFVPDPFGGAPGGRLYRTGDLVRQLPDGTVCYLGRLDHQVKIRGVRIELGEIEAALARQPGVREAVVLVREDAPGDRRLVAYVVPRADRPAPEPLDLWSALRRSLPEAMVPTPSDFVLLESLPLTANGKVDRRALARIAPAAGRETAGFVAPRGPVEEGLAAIWAEVLGADRVERVGSRDDFFALGGHSLLATQVVSRVRDAFGVELPLRALFEAPTLATLAARIGDEIGEPQAPVILPTLRTLGVERLAAAVGLSAQQRELLASLLDEEGIDLEGEPPITPLKDQEDHQLSFAQQRLWFLDQMAPGSPVYNIPAAVELTGDLQPGVLAAALAEVVRRHEALRTTFQAVDGEPVQVIAGRNPSFLPVVDLRALPEGEREKEVDRLTLEEARRPFDLGDSGGSLLRTALLRLGTARYAVLLTMHHIVSDGWSMGVLVQELGTLYAAFLAGRPSPLPELAMQYADFAAWQRRHLSDALLEPELAWWRGQLAGLPPALDLPADHPRPAALSGRGAELGFALDRESLDGLAALSFRHGATLFMTLLAGFSGLLQRITGEDDLAVGTPVAGRTRVELEPLIGFFVNTLVLRLDLAGDPDVAALLARVRETALSAYAHQEVPFERLVEELAPERDLSRPPLVQVLFVLQNAPAGRLRVPGLALTTRTVSTGTARLELACTLAETERGLEGAFEYSRDLFEAPTMVRLAGHFTRLLAALAADPRQRLSELPLLSPAERAQLLVEWSGEATAFPREATIHGLFAEQAARRPDAVAVAAAGEVLTYGELARRAGCWAQRLRDLGVGPDVRVGVCLDRSPLRVVATLAVLEAGGAYVPLDPAYPRERLDLLLRESRAEALLTEERWLPVLPETAPPGVCLDRPSPPLPPSPVRPPATDPACLAYVIYTSGSTGEPKGVAMPHRGVVRLLRDTNYARFGPDEVFLQIAPYTFDASVPEMWGALLHGGRLVMPPPGVLSLAELGALVRREGVTTLLLTAGLFRQMVDESLGDLAGVRQLLAGGDVVSVPHARRVLAELPSLRLLSMYGPTENTTFTSSYPVTAPEDLEPSVPLGRPLANTWVYVLDRGLAPVPAGVAGELCAGGDGLARGYLESPARTAERFVPDPFGREPGGRLYRTGDLVRWRPAGQLEFLGRIDTQIKVRGFRVEPGEVETALSAHPWVRQAVVLAEGERGADRHLVAYLVGGPGEAPATSELRAFLRERLPEFMLPAAFVTLAALPLTANEKVDRKALARLRPEEQPITTAAAAPRTPFEELLAGIFAAVLKRKPEQVGVTDDFFELGGHSLLATQAVARVRSAFGVELPVRALFEAPTVAALASRLERSAGLGESFQGPILGRVSREAPLPLSFAQQRLWFLDRFEPGSPLYNIPAAVRLEGDLDAAALEAALAALAERHESLRTTFGEVAGEPVQVIASTADLPLRRIDLSGLPGGRPAVARALLAAEALRPFDLAAGPLVRALLVRLDARDHLLFVNLHHIIADGWSMGVFVAELSALLAGQALPPLPVQYADFAVWQRRQVDRVLEEQLGWWRQRLAGAVPLELPADRPRPRVRSARGGTRPLAVPAALRAGVERLARERTATSFMVVLAAFQALLGRWSGQSDVAVGTPVANRTLPELEHLIGFFVNTLVLRADLAAAERFADLLAAAREATLEAWARQDVPFERVVEEVQPQRDPSRTPLFQVVLAFQNAPLGPLELPGVRLAPVDLAGGTAKFDLTLSLAEGPAGEWAGAIEHSSDLFDGATIDRLGGGFLRLLAAAVAEPGTPWEELPLLAAAERHQVLAAWNETEVAPPAVDTVLELFARRAAEAPDRPAVVDGSRVLTYGGLAESSARLAGWLARQGVGAEDVVALVAPRSLELVVAALSVARAGAAFLPLDPAHPPARLRQVLRSSGARLALTGPGVEIEDPPLPAVAIGEVCGSGPAEAPVRRIEPAQPAYVIYTSGSTGEPKGVVVSHAALLNLVAWHLRAHELTAADRCTLVASPAFDASIWEMWPALAAGAALRVVDEETRLAPERLLDLLAQDGTTVGFLPTPLAEKVLELPPPPGLALRRLLTGGDRLRRVPAGLPYNVGNHYGPTEAAVVSTWIPVEGGTERPPAIGRPIDNLRAYVLDRRGAPAPVGVPGELGVAGASLARGYLGRPDLTADTFRPDPFGPPGTRLYRTGDLVRWQAQGELEFLGRCDQQVKVRGVRIEPAEVEAALLAHPRVAAAVVMPWEGRGGLRLAAWVVAAEETGAEELRRFLAGRLPEAMVPAAWSFLPELPLTPNGKIDRRALPAPQTERETAGEAPRTPVEELVAGVWSELLGMDRIGRQDGFFDLGGHSLLATRVVSRVRELAGVEVPLLALFEEPTVEAFAQRIEEARASAAGAPAPLPPILPVPRVGAPPLSFAQQRLWFLDRLAPDNPFYNISGAVRLTGALDVAALRRAFQEIVRRHETLRTAFRLAGDGRPVQAIEARLEFPVPLIDLAAVPAERLENELGRLLRDEAGRPFDLARSPLVRTSLIRCAAHEHTLLVSLHHIISDGWSIGILFSEMAALYGAFSQGRPSPLPELPIQYADFAVWQRQQLQGERLAAELDYWRCRLAGIPETLELPLDHPRPAFESFRGGLQSFALPAELVRDLAALARRGGATLSMAMLAGFQALLGRAAGQEDLATGMAIANRTRREVEGLIGFFVNTLVVRGDLSGSPGFGRLLARVRETALAAYTHQDLPFERLVEELQPERDLGRNPLIQVMFGFQNFPRAQTEAHGLVLSAAGDGQMAGRTAKFDLTLFLSEDGGRLLGSLEYNSELFEAATIQRLLRSYESLLAGAAAQPATAVELLPLLDEAERHQLALEWTDTGSAYPAAASLQELFEEQVRSTPDATALLFGPHVLSYAELSRRANRLAHRLRDKGIGPESRVGLCMERSLEMVVGLLGILKAGGAYVPLDADYPAERLAFMIEDSGLRVLMSDGPAVARLPVHLVARTDLVLLDDGLADAFPDQDLPVTTEGSSLAYVMYTSGSTGRPKGVGVPHRAVARLVRETGYIELGPEQVFLQFAPISFDASTLEIWGALLNGAQLVLAAPHALSLAELGQILERHRVTTLWLTAGLFHQFVEHNLEQLRPVRQLLAGGEALSVPHVRRVLSELPDTRLVNGYGPTENTTFTCCHPMRGPERLGPSVPLGRAIANTSVHLLDRHDQPVPIGVAGELCTGGDGLARGYVGKPELTVERFLPNPFGGAHGEMPGSRLYRTGDLARHLADGRIEFLGRLDEQVKVRGFRIELGEIESRLGEHPAVLQNVVLAREDVPGDRRLVAYVVQDPAYEALASGELTEQVAQWSELFDDLYGQEAAGADPTFNIVGWNSSYTDLPLSSHEMAEWLEDTVGRIVSLDPRRVLEIGCGTGMILFRIASRCELYTATDVSAQALDYVERQLGPLGSLGIDRSRVQLLQRSAEQLDGMAAGCFDTVILNSVAQYFPSADFLAEVLARVVEVVRPGGAIFLGDLRSLPLLAAFHTSVELFQAEPELPLPRLRQKVQARRRDESELAVDPAFFSALRQHLPQIGRVEVYPKRGRAHNELTGFRYQVVLRLTEVEEPAEIPWLDWQEERLTLAVLRRRLEENAPDALGLRNVPNARVAEAAAAARLLREAEEGIATAGDLRRRATEAAAGAVDPQDLWNLATTLPYEIELSWAAPGSAGCFEAVLRRRDGTAAASTLLPAPQTSAEAAAAGPLSQYTNNPLQGRFARQLVPELRAFLEARLPEHMVPSAFVLLDALPLTPNGKVDRRRLPAPDLARPEIGQVLVAPRNPTEAKLAEIWRELLGIERIGIEDDFFELGGHSLLATQAVSRVRSTLGVELPLRTFFEAPSVAAVAAEVEGLRRRGGEADVPPIVPVPRDGRLPLSFAQERLWFLNRLETRTLAYNESAAFRLEGPLDTAALHWSLDEVLRRHESLRTTFPEMDGQAVQRIEPPAPFEIPAVDLRGLPWAAREAEAHRLAREQTLRPFDLARGPLVRGLLLRLGESEHAVLFSFHHIVFDGWSMGIFARELSALYGAGIAGRPSPLPPLSLHYADFAAWQRRWLRGEVLERQIAWWRERLAGAAVLALPTDRPRPVLPQAPSGPRLAAVPPALTQRLRAFSRSRGATPFMTLLAAFQTLLHRYTGQDDVTVGSPIANRDRGEVENLIGFFVNMLVLRTDLAGDPSFADLLERVRQVALGAYAHQSVPFEKLVEELRPDRDLRRTPLFQVSFQVLNVPAAGLDLPGLTPQPMAFAARSAKFDLDLALVDGEERMDGLLDYDADLFDAATLERLLAHLERLLAGALESPGSRLSELPLLSPAERSQAVAEWNDTRAALPSETRLHELFEAQVRRAPDAVALEFAGEELPYGELNARANRLAHLLRRWGVGPGVRVGLCLERSPEMVVGLLGVLKAGGAYVPLDPSYPQDRLAFMMTDARVPVLLTHERLLDAVRRQPARLLCLDTQREEMAGESAENPAPLGGVDELAYVIYTSGSTGRPKGVMNSHRAICNRLLWMQEVDGLTAADRVLQKTPYSFDVSVWEFFWPLATGARLVLARPGGHQDPDYLVRLLAQAKITTAHFVPSMLQVFLEARDVETCASLRRVICSGEALTGPLARRFFARFPAGAAPVLYNLYGPTEAAVEVTAWRCEPDSPLAAVPIGRPVANTQTYVLDPHLGPAPAGISGELHLGGVQLARGYLDRPDLTAERFIPDPFAAPERAGARLYKTGDQVRRLPGGEIVYLGRLDHQVKVRGVRIELGEIELALQALPGVREAVVIVREDTPGDARLVAYLTGDAAQSEVATLRLQLRERLPEAMVPAVFVPLPALPLLPSGKVDRKALPAPDRGPAPGYMAPRNPAEEILAEIWQEVLGRERVGAHDNFFELGGHSLLAVLLMAGIEKRFGKTLSLATLFAAPTLESLAALLDRFDGRKQGRSPLVAIQPQGDRPPFFCVHPVGGNVLCYLDLARHLPPDQPFYALQSPEPGGDQPASIEEMAALYLSELRRIQPEGPYRLGGWSMGGLVAFEMARQLERAGQELDLVVLIDTPPPAAQPGPPPSDDELATWFRRDLAGLLGHEPPEDFGEAEMRPLLATFAVNLRASRSYMPRPWSGSVTLVLSQQTFAAAAQGPEILAGWSRSALGGIETATLPGDHYSLLRPPQVARLAAELTARLAPKGKGNRAWRLSAREAIPILPEAPKGRRLPVD